jgi:hypothetical protein
MMLEEIFQIVVSRRNESLKLHPSLEYRPHYPTRGAEPLACCLRGSIDRPSQVDEDLIEGRRIGGAGPVTVLRLPPALEIHY